jgi:hypothetical protein
VGVRVVVYALALLLIVVIYSTKERALLVAPAIALVGGAALWLALYVLSGTLEAEAGGSLDRRIALEYIVVAVVGAAFILLVSRPWSP